ncbi:hypothetical protein EUX98_g3265 [Antrodiella citrinella]|uniref:Uncharacterized protein n=1 Tax=Antrodiella citrinella TaxID=2447956 RepID=A0A4S4MX06_9APHY|nr:hypothetical protein EUX98_g3265 [Antrodiella citrinella]
MEKALKVVDLKNILQQANVPITGKANKADLIAKILASPQAVDTFNAQNTPPTSAPAPVHVAAPAPAPVAEQPPAPPALTTTDLQGAATETDHPNPSDTQDEPDTPTTSETLQSTNPEPTTQSATEDEELAKRKARAKRFGTTYEEPTQPVPVSLNARGKNKAIEGAVVDKPEKVNSRNARFGTTAPPPATAGRNKRPVPAAEPADPEEEERRRKRLARFGGNAPVPTSPPVSPAVDTEVQKRLARFGIEQK